MEVMYLQAKECQGSLDNHQKLGKGKEVSLQVSERYGPTDNLILDF